MRKILLLTIISAFSILSYGQDIIFLKNGEKRTGKVYEVQADEIVYYHNNDGSSTGPKIHLPKNQIKTIVYQSGDIDTFINTTPEPVTTSSTENSKTYTSDIPDGRITDFDKHGKTFKVGNKTLARSEIAPVFMKNPTAYTYFQKYKTNRAAGTAWFITGATISGGLLLTAAILKSGPLAYTFVGFVFVWGGVAIPLNSAEKKNLTKAVQEYNRGLPYSDYHKKLNINLGFTQNGPGIIVNF